MQHSDAIPKYQLSSIQKRLHRKLPCRSRPRSCKQLFVTELLPRSVSPGSCGFTGVTGAAEEDAIGRSMELLDGAKRATVEVIEGQWHEVTVAGILGASLQALSVTVMV